MGVWRYKSGRPKHSALNLIHPKWGSLTPVISTLVLIIDVGKNPGCTCMVSLLSTMANPTLPPTKKKKYFPQKLELC